MTIEEIIMIGVLVNSFMIQGPWFIIYLIDRKKNTTNKILQEISYNSLNTSKNTRK